MVVPSDYYDDPYPRVGRPAQPSRSGSTGEDAYGLPLLRMAFNRSGNELRMMNAGQTIGMLA
jgi:hypothetical protein